MKKIILLLALTLSLFARGSEFNDITGEWVLKSINGYSTVQFGLVSSKGRGSELTLRFSPNESVFVVNHDTRYYYKIKNGNLHLTTEEKSHKQNNRTWKVDIITGFMSKNGCVVIKYQKKGMGGYYKKKGYLMCKRVNYPTPIHTMQRY